MTSVAPRDPQHRLGTATIHPADPVIAGTLGEWTVRLEVGSYGIDEGGTIKLAQRFASDWEAPQFDRPTERAFSSVRTNGNAKLAARFDRKGHIRPHMRCLVIDVYDGSLDPGDMVEIVLGDRSQGGPGIRAQTFQESVHEFLVLVDPTNACMVRPIDRSPTVAVIAGPAQSLFCVVPTDATVSDELEIFVRGRDTWGNPAAAPDSIQLEWNGTPDCVEIARGQLFCRQPGTGFVLITADDMAAVSNPITVHAERPERIHYWGDLHAQTDATVGTGTEDEYFTYGRDEARLDFTSHQGNDFQMTDEDWHRLNQVVSRYHVDGQFVVFPGYEWSANSPAGGDRNVFYLEEGQPIIRSSHWQVPEVPETELTPAHPASELFQRIRSHVDLDKVLLASHVGGRFADIRRDFDEQLGPLVEVVSCWGIFEWMLWDAFDRGYKVGVMCNSDGHKGRPGDEGPGAGEFGIGSGLTCVLAESLTRTDVFRALKQRHCYGTSGPRIRLDFQVQDAPMGSEIEARESVSVVAEATGVMPLESLELFQGRECIQTVQPPAFSESDRSRRVRVMWSGSRIRGRGRRATWDGEIVVSGNQILDATPIAFDSPADGILERDERRVLYRSRTTGDPDGIELLLAEAGQGTISWTSPLGELHSPLEQLATKGISRKLGGLDLQASLRRYPQQPEQLERQLALKTHWQPLAGRTVPLFVKVTQIDGHMAWSSPVYITGSS